MKENKKSSTSNKKNTWLWPGVAVVVVLSLAQFALDIYFYRLFIRQNDPAPVAQLITTAAEALYKPAPVEAATGGVFIADAKLQLPPATNPHQELLYNNLSEGDSLMINFTTRTLLDHIESKVWVSQANSRGWERSNDVFEHVPELQACGRGVQVFSKPQTSKDMPLQDQGTKKLADGRMLYFYTETTCKDNLTPLVDYIKQIQSY